MFSKVYGKIVEKQGNCISLSVNNTGIFIDFLAPASSKISDIDDEMIVHLHHCIKDVNGTLNETWFGFNKKEEKDFFLKLISIKGVGEKTAIAILSFYNPGEVISIVKNKDSKLLSKVPKIGGKTAEKFLLDMDKLLDPVFISKFSNQDSNSSPNFTTDSIIAEAAAAIKGLGDTKCDKLLNKIAEESIFSNSSDLVTEYFKQNI